MVKKAGSRRQIIPQGLSKGTRSNFRSRKDGTFWLSALLKQSRRDWLVKKAVKCIKFIRKVPGQWCLVPVVEVDSGKFEVSSTIPRVLSLILMSLITLLGAVRAGVVVQGILNQTITEVQAVLCITAQIALWGTWLIALPCIFKPQETVDLLNASDQILRHVSRKFGRHISLLKVAFCLQVILLQGFVVVVPFEFTASIIILGPFPTDIFTLVSNLGWIPSIGIPQMLWPFLFCILEYSIVLACELVSVFSVYVLIVGVATTKCCLNNIQREFTVTDTESREQLEELCMTMQVYNKVFMIWEKVFMPLMIFLVSCVAIALTYIVIRCRELPLLLYCMMPLIGASVAGLFNLNCDEMIKIKKSSENILSTLQSSTPAYLGRMGRSERLAVLKRAKSMRPSLFPIGDYGEISYGVLVNVWEEVLDQLLLLLSL